MMYTNYGITEGGILKYNFIKLYYWSAQQAASTLGGNSYNPAYWAIGARIKPNSGSDVIPSTAYVEDKLSNDEVFEWGYSNFIIEEHPTQTFTIANYLTHCTTNNANTTILEKLV